MIDLEYIIDIVKKNYISLIGIAIGGLSIIASGLYVYYNKPEPTEKIVYKESTECLKDKKNEQSTIKVDIKGAVKKAGVYELTTGSNIQDAINSAGGITSKGTTSNINLSKKLIDEMVIYVFTKEELKNENSSNKLICEIPKCECETVTVTECPKVNESDIPDSKEPDKNLSNSKISINTGNLEELMKLDGVGESKAKAIIEYREKNGKFVKIEDIMNVSGIGEKAYEKIKDNITL